MGGSTEIMDERIADRDSSFVHPSSLAICLVSGGMDSCVTAAIARTENKELAFLHVSYGQRTEQRERRCFEELADYFRVDKRLAVSIDHLSRIGGLSFSQYNLTCARAPIRGARIPPTLCAV